MIDIELVRCRIDVERLFRGHVRNLKPNGQQATGLCPFHEDHAASFSVSLKTGLYKCFACDAKGDVFDFYKRVKGVDFQTALKELAAVAGITEAKPPKPMLVAKFEYRDVQGKLLYSKERTEPGRDGRRKEFAFYHMDSSEKRQSGRGCGPVLYNLQEVIKARSIIIVEGEAKADLLASWGLTATCLDAGAQSKLNEEMIQHLTGKRIAIPPDNDAPGTQYALNLARALVGKAETIRIAHLPGLVEKGDIIDWAKIEGNNKEKLLELIKSTPEWTPGVSEDKDDRKELTKEPTILDWLKPSGLFDLKVKPSFKDLESVISWVANHACELTGYRLSLARLAIIEQLNALGMKGVVGLVDGALGKKPGDKYDEGHGEAIILTDPEPWSDPVDGGELLTEIAELLTRYVILLEGVAQAIALWVMLTYLIDATDILPILGITSPEKRCGKTLLLEILCELVSRRLPAANITPAAMFRTVEKSRPTLLIDEADTFLEKNEELRGIINSGHRRSGAFVIRSVGDDNEPRTFRTWCPKVLAKIGPFASTIEDRSIMVSMKRKAPGEKVARFSHRKTAPFLADIRQKCTRWAKDNLTVVRDVDPPDLAFLHDRANDNWRPLLAIADVAGGEWPDLARQSAKLLSGTREDVINSVRVQVLMDIHALFEDQDTDRLQSAEIVKALGEMEDRPWPEWKNGKAITANQLATLLRPFGVKPTQFRDGGKTRGYLFKDFEDSFLRYLPLVGSVHPVHFASSAGCEPKTLSVRRDTCTGSKNVENGHPVGNVPVYRMETGERGTRRRFFVI